MAQALQFAILGLGAGAAYTLLAQGIVLIYRGSGIVNFAHGALAMFAAFFCFLTLVGQHGWALVEQHVRQALGIADRVYVMQRGRIVMGGTVDEMRGRIDEVEATYLSSAPEGDGEDAP